MEFVSLSIDTNGEHFNFLPGDFHAFKVEDVLAPVFDAFDIVPGRYPVVADDEDVIFVAPVSENPMCTLYLL